MFDFEYSQRWPDIAPGLWEKVDILEARDQALEDHLVLFGTGTCGISFNYTYRWTQILQQDVATQIMMLEARDQALEAAVTASGGCTLEIPYRWVQFYEGLLAGEGWAIALAEENDRAIEARFGTCTCGPATTSITFEGVIDYTLPFTGVCLLPASSNSLRFQSLAPMPGSGTVSYEVQQDGAPVFFFGPDFVGLDEPMPLSWASGSELKVICAISGGLPGEEFYHSVTVVFENDFAPVTQAWEPQ